MDTLTHPLFMPRAAAWLLILVLFFAEFHILGFHEPAQPEGMVVLCTAWIILAICRAADYVVKAQKNANQV